MSPAHTVNYCRAIAQEGQASWPDTSAGSTAQGTCIVANGYEGIAIRTCSAAAIWGAITTACTAIETSCPSIVGYQGTSNWPETKPGVTATGTCSTGFQFADAGPPSRLCIGNNTGLWSTTVDDNCVAGS